MVRNYLLMAFRNFQRQKFFLLLNMFGLGLGLASAILIFLYVSDELRYDTMHPAYADTYRIGSTWTNKAGESFDNTVAPGAWIRRMKDTRSEVLQATRIDYIGYPTSFHHKATDKIILSEEVKWVEPGFDAIMAFEPVKGNREKMFSDYNTMVLSETGARRIFGTADPLGQVITVKHNWATQGREIDVVVTGVYRDYPANSHFKPHYILNVNALRSVVPDFTTYMEGTRFGRGVNPEFFENYVVLKPGTDLRPIETMLTEMGTDMTQSDSGLVANGWKIKPLIKKVADLHFDQKNLWENDNTQGSMEYLLIFSAVALLILFIACINYMNLATARSARRAKEVGLRKSFGSRRSQIAKQFLYESGITTAGSLMMSLVMVMLLLQPFNQLAHKSFTVGSLFDPYVVAIIVIISVAMAFLSGSYPAFYLSAFKPVDVLKGQAVKGRGAEIFRKSLVTVQYTISLVLIIATVIIVRQMQFMQHTKLNQQGSQLLSIRYGGNAPQSKFPAFKHAVLQDKDIRHVTMANHLPRLNYFGWIGARVKFTQFEDKELQWNQLNVDFDFPKTYQLEFIAGRDFDPNSIMDSSTLILNEAAVKALNKPIEQVIGARVTDLFENNRTYTVVGVVKDFPFRSMHQEIEPLLLKPRVHPIDRIAYIKLPPGKFQEKIASIEKTWREFFPDSGFDYWFVSDEFNRMYQTERRISSLAKSFALLAIVITVLGIFGLASYTAEQKTKEVGIRKVLGASVGQMVIMLAALFVRIAIIASLFALPAAYVMAAYWLRGFTYKSTVGPFVFILPVLGLIVVTVVTVSYETWKAARTNPVNVLRAE